MGMLTLGITVLLTLTLFHAVKYILFGSWP